MAFITYILTSKVIIKLIIRNSIVLSENYKNVKKY